MVPPADDLSSQAEIRIPLHTRQALERVTNRFLVDFGRGALRTCAPTSAKLHARNSEATGTPDPHDAFFVQLGIIDGQRRSKKSWRNSREWTSGSRGVLQCYTARGGRSCDLVFFLVGRVRGSALKPRVTSRSPWDLGFADPPRFF